MAIWQYNFFVLPKDSVEEFNPSYDFKQENGLFEASHFWKYENIKLQLFDDVADFLPLSKSWSKNLTIYGMEDSNCLKILTEDGFIVSVTLRIDFTTMYENVLEKIIIIFMHNGLLLLDESLKVTPLSFYEIRTRVEHSRQFSIYSKMRDEGL